MISGVISIDRNVRMYNLAGFAIKPSTRIIGSASHNTTQRLASVKWMADSAIELVEFIDRLGH
jgi:hypothetical protein